MENSLMRIGETVCEEQNGFEGNPIDEVLNFKKEDSKIVNAHVKKTDMKLEIVQITKWQR